MELKTEIYHDSDNDWNDIPTIFGYRIILNGEVIFSDTNLTILEAIKEVADILNYIRTQIES